MGEQDKNGLDYTMYIRTQREFRGYINHVSCQL
jgi:hypothetical protein